jgi:hypothetical protein
MGEPGAPPGKGFEISVEDDHVLVRANPARVVSADVMLSILHELFGLAAYRSENAALLLDFRGCETDLRYDTVEEIGRFVSSHFDPSWSHRFTALVADAEVLYGMARMYEALTERVPTESQVFRELEQAREWLKEKVAAAR